MNLIETTHAYLEHNWDGLEFLVRDKNTFHSRDASVVYRTPFSKAETELRVKHGLCPHHCEGKCMRALYYDFVGEVVTNPTEAIGIRTMDLGNCVEDLEREYYKKLGIFHSAHVRLFNKEYQISGEIDNLVWEFDDVLDPITNQRTGKVIIREPRRLVGVEIKSFYGYYAEKEILTLGKPKMNHVLQSLIYLDHYKPNLPYWLLVYISRSGGVDTPNGRMVGRQFKIQISKLTGEVFIDGVLLKEFAMKDVYSRFKEAEFYIQNKQLPPRDYVYKFPDELVELKYLHKEISISDHKQWKAGNKYISDWECQYCPYLYPCWKDVHGRSIRGAPPVELVMPKETNDVSGKEGGKKKEEEDGNTLGKS